MNIAFDAKRFFHNTTGLGNYSRTLVYDLADYFPENEYYLFNPKHSGKYALSAHKNIHEVLPKGFLSKRLSSLWRSNWVRHDLKQMKMDLYHGLSHEIPMGIESSGIPSVVTIHDLIFERYPEQFSKIDVQIYRKKFRNACENASRIIAISNQTKKDIVEMYGIKEEKIDICYQSCDPAFSTTIAEDEKETLRGKYSLPEKFILSVGSIIERKNLLNICKALKLISKENQLPLVVIGNGSKYKQTVKKFLVENHLVNQIIFLSETSAKAFPDFYKPRTIAGIYQMAEMLVYPSFFEGFGIPVLEGLLSKIPVITSNVSSLPEVGGNAALYVDPDSPTEIAKAIESILKDKELKNKLTAQGIVHAKKFGPEACTRSVMDVYKKLIP